MLHYGNCIARSAVTQQSHHLILPYPEHNDPNSFYEYLEIQRQRRFIQILLKMGSRHNRSLTTFHYRRLRGGILLRWSGLQRCWPHKEINIFPVNLFPSGQLWFSFLGYCLKQIQQPDSWPKYITSKYLWLRLSQRSSLVLSFSPYGRSQHSYFL